MKGIRIAKDDETVNDGIDNQYVDTEQPLFKLYLSDEDSVTFDGSVNYTAGSPYQIKIPHNLGYWPMCFVYMDRSANANRKFVTNIDTAFPENTVEVIGTFDNNNIYLNVNGGFLTGEFGYNYEIFYDKVGQDV